MVKRYSSILCEDFMLLTIEERSYRLFGCLSSIDFVVFHVVIGTRI